MRCAFGECAYCGVKPPFAAAAIPAVARTAPSTKTSSNSFRRTRRAFYEGGRALAGRPTDIRARRFRRVRRGRAPGSWRRLRGRRTVGRLPAADRAGGPARLLAVALDLARHRGLVPKARERGHRLRAGRPQAGGDGARAGPVLSGGAAAPGGAQELEHGVRVDVVEVECIRGPEVDRAVDL